MRRIAIIAAVIIIATVVAAIVLTSPWKARYGSGPSETSEPSPRVQTFESMLLVGNNAIYVDDQRSGSSTVYVGFAVLKDRGYVEIRSDDGGLPGDAIGRSALLPPGGGEHFEVALNRPLVDGEVYYAMLLHEDGLPVTDAEGNVMLMSFTAREDAEPETGVVLP
jgi:hypothetical protein